MSKSAHVLPDYLAENLVAVFCGTAVATASRDRGGYYAGPGNEFWEYLYHSRLTGERLSPETDHRVLEFRIGLTDLVKDTAASSDRELSGYDVMRFIRQMRRYRPRWIAFHGKGAAKAVARALDLRSDIRLGRQDWAVDGIPVYVVPSASGSNRDPSRLEGKRTRLDWYRAFAATLARSERQASDG